MTLVLAYISPEFKNSTVTEALLITFITAGHSQ